MTQNVFLWGETYTYKTKFENVTSFFECLFFSGQIFNKHSSQVTLKQDSMLFILVHYELIVHFILTSKLCEIINK